jgi:hypothetical protein
MIRTGPLAAAIALSLSAATPGLAQIRWQNQSPAGVTDDIWSVTYGGGMFAATTAQGNILTSTDGLDWVSQSVSPGTWLVSIAFGSGTWVAVGTNGAIVTSTDLKAWTAAKSGTANRLDGVLYAGAVFIVVGEAGTILTSPDAKTWTAQASGATGFLHGITYDPVYGSILVSGQAGTLLVGYQDGALFAPVNGGTPQDIEAVLYSAANPVGTVAAGANGSIAYNSNGPPIEDIEVLGIFDSGWTTAATPGTTARFRGLASGNGQFVAAGELGTILTSTDGMTWVQRFSGDSMATLSTATLLGAAYSPLSRRFVVVGTGGTILVSNGAPTAVANVSTRGTVTNSQPLIGGFVVQGTTFRSVLIRADGPVLSAFGVTGSLPDPVLTIYDSNKNVVGTNTGWTVNSNTASIAAAASSVGAFALPNPSKDSALLVQLSPGAYTAVITSAGGSSGTALFEAYTD